MPRAGRKKVLRYSLEFKCKAGRLTQLPGVEVQAVATPWTSIRSCCRAGGEKRAMVSYAESSDSKEKL